MNFILEFILNNFNLNHRETYLSFDLRNRFTQSCWTFLWKPWVYGSKDFNSTFRYLCLHSHFFVLQKSLHYFLRWKKERSTTKSFIFLIKKKIFTSSVFCIFPIFMNKIIVVPLSCYAINWDGSFQAYPTDRIIIKIILSFHI